MNSICDGIGSARAKSVMKKTAPLRTPISRRSPSGGAPAG